MPIDYFVWVARSKNRTYVIDTGFNTITASKRNKEIMRCPVESLKLVDVDPADVEDVIITHLIICRIMTERL
jgi:glyoxylase-like metal-dependent hydrolase (beta-lactamase superfamily II)